MVGKITSSGSPPVATEQAEGLASLAATKPAYGRVAPPADATGQAIAGAKQFGAQEGGAPEGSTAGLLLLTKTFAQPEFTRMFARPAVNIINETTESMSIAHGAAWDAVESGRFVDVDLVIELARQTWTLPSGIRPPLDPVDRQVDVGELAARGIINAQAFKQITNNTNLKGFKQPLAERVALALAAQDAGGMNDGFFINVVEQADPETIDIMDVLHSVIGSKEPKRQWKALNRDRAAAILQSAANGTLLQSSELNSVLRVRVAQDKESGSLDERVGVPGHLAFQSARKAGFSVEESHEVELLVSNHGIDLSTLQFLMTKRLGSQMKSAGRSLLPFGDVKALARGVAVGDFSLGQVQDFVGLYIPSSNSIPGLPVKHAPSLLRSLNKGEFSQKELNAALNTYGYWEDFESLKVEPGLWAKLTGAEAVDSGDISISIPQHLNSEMAAAFAKNPDRKMAFFKTVSSLVSDGLRTNSKQVFQNLVEQSVDQAKRAHGF